jgi:hypothetical protein
VRMNRIVRGMIVRGMELIPLTTIPLTNLGFMPQCAPDLGGGGFP